MSNFSTHTSPSTLNLKWKFCFTSFSNFFYFKTRIFNYCSQSSELTSMHLTNFYKSNSLRTFHTCCRWWLADRVVWTAARSTRCRRMWVRVTTSQTLQCQIPTRWAAATRHHRREQHRDLGNQIPDTRLQGLFHLLVLHKQWVKANRKVKLTLNVTSTIKITQNPFSWQHCRDPKDNFYP